MWGWEEQDVFEDDGQQGGLLSSLGRNLLDWNERSTSENLFLCFFAFFLVCFAGCMSGLTLGLLSLDRVGLEVLKRSGTEKERKHAAVIIPLVEHTHYLLVTLLLCNAFAMEALPIVLDKLVHEAVAIAISVTGVLFFGEIIPQSICTRYGLAIGAMMAGPVRVLMVITTPVSYPIAKLLDHLLGHDEPNLFKRNQLKTLVKLHARHEGFGGKLSNDECQIITGALDLTQKQALGAMTPMQKVFMLSTQQVLDEPTVRSVMAAKPFSRVPVYRDHDRSDIVGMVLVADLLETARRRPGAPVASLELRPIPRLPATTPMYDVLRLFRSGHSHMAILTQPMAGSEDLISSLNLMPVKKTGTDSANVSDDGSEDSYNGIEDDDHNNGKSGKPVHKNGKNGKTGKLSRWASTTVLVQFASKMLSRENSRETKAEELSLLKLANTEKPPRDSSASTAWESWSGTNSRRRSDSGEEDVDVEADPIPTALVAIPGEPIGIITFEDVIEELLQFEIVDETDRFLDNEQSVPVSHRDLHDGLPEPLLVAMALSDSILALFKRNSSPTGSPKYRHKGSTASLRRAAIAVAKLDHCLYPSPNEKGALASARTAGISLSPPRNAAATSPSKQRPQPKSTGGVLPQPKAALVAPANSPAYLQLGSVSAGVRDGNSDGIAASPPQLPPPSMPANVQQPSAESLRARNAPAETPRSNGVDAPFSR